MFKLSKLSKSFGIIALIETISFMVFVFVGAMVEMPSNWSWILVGFGLGSLISIVSLGFHVILCRENFDRLYVSYHVYTLATGLSFEIIGLIFFLTGIGTVFIGIGLSYIVCIPMSMIFFRYNLHSEELNE